MAKAARAAAAPPKKAATRKTAAPRKARVPELHIDPDAATAELCRRHLKDFVIEFWDTIIAEPLIWEPHMDVLCMEIEAVYRRIFMQYKTDDQGNRIPIGRLPKAYDLIINIPPGTSKSSIVTVMAPAWGWVNDPTLRVFSAAYSSKSVSVPQAVQTRDIIRSPKFQLYFPYVQVKDDTDNKGDYRTTALGQRYASSPGGSATSQHFHIITLDDIINPKGALSKTLIDATNTWMDGTLATRKVDKAVTVTILIMQRLATTDPTGHWLKKKGKRVRHICLPATISSKVRPKELRGIYQDGVLSPVRMPKHVLSEMKIDMGSNAYAGQMDQSPIPLGGGTWKPWFIEVPDEVFPSAKLMTKYGTDWDLAYTAKEENSASAYVTGGRIGSKIYIDDIGWDWLEMPKLIKYMKERPKPHFIEAKASGKSAKQILTSQKVTAIEIQVLGGADKIARANMATPVAESGVVYIRKSIADRLYNDAKQGILLFPKAEHTDLADALAQFLQRLDSRADVKVANEYDDDNTVLQDPADDDLDF